MLRDLPSLEKRVVDIEQQLRAIKNRQYIGGQDILNYRTFSGSGYDWSVRIYQSSPLRVYRITFTHATAKEGALLRLSVYSSWNTSNVMSNPIPYATPSAPPVLTRWRKEISSDGTKTSWIVMLSKGNFGVEYYDTWHKIFIEGSDTGTWTVQEI